ncbi:MAG: integrase core domain-containing protein, partial [Nitrospirota bacterium]
TPRRSPESNGLAEAFFGSFKRDYVYQACLETFETVGQQIPVWLDHSNQQTPHSALGMQSPAAFYADWRVKNTKRPVQNEVGQYTVSLKVLAQQWQGRRHSWNRRSIKKFPSKTSLPSGTLWGLTSGRPKESLLTNGSRDLLAIDHENVVYGTAASAH